MNLGDGAKIVKEDCQLAATPNVVESLSSLRNARVLVTGGTGFVGTWVAELVTHLNDAHGFGCRLLLLSTRPEKFSEHAPHLAGRSDIELITRDVRYIAEISPDVTHIIHAAGTPDSRVHSSDPLQTLHVFIDGIDAVLRAAVRLPALQKFLHVSSGLVYGPQPVTLDRMPESYRGGADWASVASAYTESKRAAETLAAAYRTQHRLPIVTVRPFAFLGPYQHLDRPWAINNFMQDASRGGPIRILGNGDTVRSYMYPSDMAVWMLTALVRGQVGADYNVGSPRGISLRDLAELVRSQFPSRVEIQSGVASRRVADTTRFVPDVTLAQGALGVGASVDLDTALRRTLQWHQSVTSEPRRYAIV